MLNKKTKRIIGGVLLLICIVQLIAIMVIRDGSVRVLPDAVWLVMLVVSIVLLLDVKIKFP